MLCPGSKPSRRKQPTRGKAGEKITVEGVIKELCSLQEGKALRLVVEETGKLYLVPGSIPKVSNALQGLQP